MKRFRVSLHYSCGDPKTIRFETLPALTFAVLQCALPPPFTSLWQAGERRRARHVGL